MLPQPENQSLVVFPFLKTYGPARLGGLTFRPTDATDDLPDEQEAYLRDVADMLFLQDDLRIRSASYAFVPFIDPAFPAAAVEHLACVQQVVAYCYTAPRHSFGDIFLTPEHASLAIFTPHRVSVHLVRPSFHVDAAGPAPDLAVDQFGNMPGYAGLYNFRHHFWVTKGSRLYGPLPHMSLNIDQDLGHDLARAAARADYRLLIDWLGRPVTPTSARIFTALRWFNAANSAANDDAAALVDLAIAFEALLSLPADEKTDRLVDAISLLLGRIPRLDVWARQFYDARSKVAHEGRAQQVRFVATDSRRGGDGPLYQSLLSYGRQVFQLCLAALLVGAELAHNAGLEETLITNQERFRKICTVLADESVSTGERLARIAPLVAAAEQYQYVPESGLQLTALLGATRLAVKVLLEHDGGVAHELKQRLQGLTAAPRSADHFEELEALRALNDAFPDDAPSAEMNGGDVVQRMVKLVWMYVFMHYYWLKERRTVEPPLPNQGGAG